MAVTGRHQFKLYRVELVRESAKRLYAPKEKLQNTDNAAKVAREVFEVDRRPGEFVGMLCLDAGNRLVGCHVVAEGTMGACPVFPREVATRALLNNAASIILVHNHPGGTEHASPADWNLTERIYKACKTLDLGFLDHIILADEENVSMRSSAKWGDMKNKA